MEFHHEAIHGPHQQRRDQPTLFVDTTKPLHILLDAAGYRIRAVTQVLENLAMRGDIASDSVILSDFALLCAIQLRDGCDVLDVIGRLDKMPGVIKMGDQTVANFDVRGRALRASKPEIHSVTAKQRKARL
jgi:hypothetical protein